MGYYINRTSKGNIGLEKAQSLIDDCAKEIQQPTEFKENLVCVVNNGFFEAAGYMYNESEFKAFTDPTDPRTKRWFVWDKAKEFAE